MNKLANIVLKLNSFGSCIPLTYVTPAEVMFLVADHHVNAGGDPIISLEEIDIKTDEKALAAAKSRHESITEKIEALDEDNNITPEVRHQRSEELHRLLTSAEDEVSVWQSRLTLRTIGSGSEKARLSSKYNAISIDKFYPGKMPNLPTTFEEARSDGIGAKVESEKLLSFEAK